MIRANWTDMQFSRYWFKSRNQATFELYVKPAWAGKRLTYCEIGIFEGMSMVWMLQHVLTHPKSRAVGIDPWLWQDKRDSKTMDTIRRRAVHNVKLELRRQRRPLSTCQLYRMNSAMTLRMMQKRRGFAGIKAGTLDLCMIDGNHTSLAVLDDARQVYKLLRPGGQVLFDDVVSGRTKVDAVREGLDLWLAEAKGKVKPVWRHRFMECYEKTIGDKICVIRT